MSNWSNLNMAKRTNKVVFKEYTPNQLMLLPQSLEEKIKPDHPVRVVNDVIEKINITPLLKKYEGGGTSSYHPKMLLKVMVYSYLTNIYSSRRIEEALQQNIHFMWLSGMNEPDHNTINRFRGERLKDVLKPIFVQVVHLLSESGLVSLKEVYVDGTKIEANANRYTFVWGNAIKTTKQKMAQQLDELWRYAQQTAAEEMKDTEPLTFEQIDEKKVKETIATIDAALSGKEVSPKVQAKINYVKKNWIGNLKRYKEQERILGKRKSYSKTDKDATFMRMKEDHMKNGQLKPGYNLQISSNNQVIINYTLHPNPTDTTTLKGHIKEHRKIHGCLPAVLTADAGYGSEENYNYLEKSKIKGFVKFSSFDREQRKNYKQQNDFHQNQLTYDKENDRFLCPIGEPMDKISVQQQKSENGYLKTVHLYKAQNCKGCFLKQICHQSEENRIIKVNHKLREYQLQAQQRLTSEDGIRHRKQRCHDVEPVFAQIKHNKGFKRFNLRGIKKVEVETGLLAIAHNLAKKAA